MFDVVPPNAEEFDREEGLGRSRRRGLVRGKRRGVGWQARKYGETDVGKKTVEVEWKLPARLRKPVRDQLQKERAQRQRRQAAIKFNRRPIHTQIVSRSAPRGSEGDANRGAEKHMGDTYRHSKPNVLVAVPPYQGKALARQVQQKSLGAKTDAMKRRPRMQPQRVEKRIRARSVARADKGRWSQGERDAPYDWRGQGQQKGLRQKVSVATEAEPDTHRALSLPFSFSLWPSSWGRATGKKKITTRLKRANLAILLIGLGVAWGLVWNLQGAGRGFAVLGAVQQKARQAMGQLGAAQSALAEADLETGEASLAEAERLLAAARSDVDEALRASEVVLKYADVTGKVRSGEALLTAGQELTGAGKNVVRGLQRLQGTEPVVGAEVLGEEAKIEEGMTLVDGMSQAQADFEQALAQMEVASEALEDVTVARLPEEVQPAVQQLLVVVPRMREVLRSITEQSDSLLYLLGETADRQYLLAFANNHELRPVGGFVGTVGLVNMDRGRVENIDIDSVYHHDGQLRDFIAPPEPLQKIVDRWYMRDANWFVNYPVSAAKMAEFLEKEAGPTVDGVVLMTPAVIQRLLRLSGPIMVPGYEVVVTADNFVEVTQSQVTYEYDTELNRPKQFLADLTPLLLQKILTDAGQVPALVALTEAINRKELLMYFRDNEAQAGLKELGWDGALPADKPGFLAVNTANIGGHKSDQFVQQEIDYRSQLQKNGEVEVTVTIRREHNGPTEGLDIDYPEGENPSVKDNVVYQRVLVPPEAELVEASGFTAEKDVPQVVAVAEDLPLRLDPELAAWQGVQEENRDGTIIGEEAGYKYFSHWQVTRPGQTTVGLYRYRLPGPDLPKWWDRASSYQGYVYKQAGDDRTTIRASVEVPDGYGVTHAVPAEGITREEMKTVWRGDLQRDMAFGVVIEPQS